MAPPRGDRERSLPDARARAASQPPSATAVAPLKPYERDESRVLALYRVPLPAGPQRILELCCGRVPLLPGEPWRGERAVTAILDDTSTRDPAAPQVEQVHVDARAPLPFGSQAFDLVMLHGTLDALMRRDARWRAPRALDDLVRRAADVLAPGGVVAGCVRNRTLRSYLRAGAREQPAGAFTLRSCAAMLERVGLTDVRVFTLIPHADAPLALISSERGPSRQAFLRELEVVRPMLTPPAYLARRLVAELALNRWLEYWLFFCGVRA